MEIQIKDIKQTLLKDIRLSGLLEIARKYIEETQKNIWIEDIIIDQDLHSCEWYMIIYWRNRK